jgi:hypothetical protein
MINPRELRIGNAFIAPHGGFERVSSIDTGFINTVYHYEKCNPAPLTEEQIIKCGFEKTNFTWYDKSVSEGIFVRGNLFVEFCNEGIIVLARITPSKGNEFISTVQFAHQLENFFFLLNGFELSLVLTPNK